MGTNGVLVFVDIFFYSCYSYEAALISKTKHYRAFKLTLLYIDDDLSINV
jgi:hypothetical protein